MQKTGYQKELKSIFLALLIVFSISLEAVASERDLHVFLQDSVVSPYSDESGGLIKGSVYPAIFGFLLKTDSAGDIKPGLIRNWKYDFRENTYTFTLSNGKFQNGRTITAVDLEFSMTRSYLSNLPHYSHTYFSDIEGTEILKKGARFKTGMVSGIKILNDQTIRIKLKNRNPNYLKKLTGPFSILVPIEELLESDYAKWKSVPVGAGPYRVKSDFKDRQVVLERVSVDDSRPKLIYLHCQRKRDRYDLLFENAFPSSAESDFNVNLGKNPASLTSVFFVRRSKLANNFDFRKAIYHGIDREGALSSSLQLKPATQILLKTEGGSLIKPKAKNPYDRELAKKHLKRVPKDLLNKTVRISVFSIDTKSLPPVVAKQLGVIKKQLEELGLKVIMEPSIENKMTDKMLDTYDLRISSMLMDYVEPLMAFSTMIRVSPFWEEMPDSQGKVDRFYDETEKQDSVDGFFRGLKKLSDLVDDNHFVVPIFQRYILYRTNPDTIKSLGDQVRPHYLDLSQVELK